MDRDDIDREWDDDWLSEAADAFSTVVDTQPIFRLDDHDLVGD